MKKLFSLFLGCLLLPSIAFAQLNTFQGGTGLVGVAAGSIPFGSSVNIRLATSSSFSFSSAASRLTVTNASTTVISSGTICFTGDLPCRTTWPTAGSAFAWTPTTYSAIGVNATSTGLWLKATSPFSLIASSTFITSASSTQLTNSGATWLTGIGTLGGVSVDSNGKLYSSASTTFSTGLTYSGATNAVTVNTSQNIATLSNLTTNGIVTTSGGVGTLVVDGTPLDIANGGTNATSFSVTNGVAVYDGTRLSGVASYVLTSLGLSIVNGTSTGSFASTGSTTLANYAYSNALGNQSTTTSSFSTTASSSNQFSNNASTTVLSVSNTNVVGDGNKTSYISTTRGLNFSYGTTSAWTGSTTVLDIGIAPFGITFSNVYCHTDTGTLVVQLQYGTGPTKPAALLASSTIGIQTLSANNTPAKGNDIAVVFGTPASSPTFVACTAFGPQTSI